MGTYSTVACNEMENTLQVDFDAITGEITASVDLMVAWGARWTLIADLLNNNNVLPDYGSGAPVALRATVKPFGDWTANGQAIAYSDAIVTVQYGPPKWDEIGSFDIVAESIEPSAEFRILPYQNFRWTDQVTGDPLIEEEAPGKLEIKLNLVRQIYKVPTPLNALTLTATGKCHDAIYTSPLLGLTFPAESLLYLEPSFERTLRNDGTDGVNYTQKWSIKPEGWNKYWRAKTKQYEEIFETSEAAGTAYKSYEPIDLTALLA
jgi:hypothetical protein